jgi:hypothetical protein
LAGSLSFAKVAGTAKIPQASSTTGTHFFSMFVPGGWKCSV